MKTNLLSPVLSLFLLSQAVFLANAETHKPEDSGKRQHPMTRMIAPKSGGDFESAFLGMMVMHHRDGVAMARMAKEKATDAELREMAAKMETAQQKEIEKMQRWDEKWHDGRGVANAKPPEKSVQEHSETMSALTSAKGAEFDRLFARKMAKHHDGGIEMAEIAVDKAEHAEVKKFGQDIVAAQTEERKKLIEKAGSK
jgi:uncharacterized protein (DUF305 family)